MEIMARKASTQSPSSKSNYKVHTQLSESNVQSPVSRVRKQLQLPDPSSVVSSLKCQKELIKPTELSECNCNAETQLPESN